MKNQYFGDNRDLFKYDLVLRIIQAGLVDRFTFIPMLTEKDDTEYGEDRDRDNTRAETNNTDLLSFLNEFEDKGKRDIGRLPPFFKRHNMEIIIYRADEYFSEEQRDSYFKQIAREFPPKSVILVDPDIGLEPEGKTKK